MHCPANALKVKKKYCQKKLHNLANLMQCTHTHTHMRAASGATASGRALSNSFLSPSQQSVLPVATHVDTEASGVAHKWTPTPSLWTQKHPQKYMWVRGFRRGGGEKYER